MLIVRTAVPDDEASAKAVSERAYGAFRPLDDTGLCEECSGRFERDLIRMREWAYSAAAFGLSAEQCEILRGEVIRQYGSSNEILVAPGRTRKRRTRRRH